ncbi:MAG: hypothetical protein R3C19_15055 [Planctomycetaceae bacterium]
MTRETLPGSRSDQENLARSRRRLTNPVRNSLRRLNAIASRPSFHARSGAALLVPSILLTIVVESVTCFLRFGCRLQSTMHTASTIGSLTCGIRIHHGYIGGVMMLAACLLWDRFPLATKWLLIAALALLLSDAIHHFLVLWPVTGSPQFDLVYP